MKEPIFIHVFFFHNFESVANSLDPDQTPPSAVSDLGLRSLPRLPVRILRVNAVFDQRHALLILIFVIVSRISTYIRDTATNIRFAITYLRISFKNIRANVTYIRVKFIFHEYLCYSHNPFHLQNQMCSDCTVPPV